MSKKKTPCHRGSVYKLIYFLIIGGNMTGKTSEQWSAISKVSIFLIAGLVIVFFPMDTAAQGLRLKKEISVPRGSGEGLLMQVPFIRERQINRSTGLAYGSLNNANNSNYYDFENDGIPEIIFIHTDYYDTKIEIYDGATYNLKYTIVVDSAKVNPMDGFGNTSVGFLDVDGDGSRELVGEFAYPFPSPYSGGYSCLLFIDVKTGKIEYSIQGYSLPVYPDGYDGYAFYDIDHDSYPEVLCRWHDTTQLRLRIYGNGSSMVQPSISPLNKKTFIAPSNFPNPFSNGTRIEYYVPSPENTVLTIYNSEGRIIRTLVNKKHLMGEYSIVWDGKNGAGQIMGAGQYYYQLKIGDFVSTKRMISLK
jgi:hypothetical protein